MSSKSECSTPEECPEERPDPPLLLTYSNPNTKPNPNPAMSDYYIEANDGMDGTHT